MSLKHVVAGVLLYTMLCGYWGYFVLILGGYVWAVMKFEK